MSTTPKRVTIQAPDKDSKDGIKKEFGNGRRPGNFPNNRQNNGKGGKPMNPQDRQLNYELVGQSYDSLVTL